VQAYALRLMARRVDRSRRRRRVEYYGHTGLRLAKPIAAAYSEGR
jgi:hypothetical protein